MALRIGAEATCAQLVLEQPMSQRHYLLSRTTSAPRGRLYVPTCVSSSVIQRIPRGDSLLVVAGREQEQSVGDGAVHRWQPANPPG